MSSQSDAAAAKTIIVIVDSAARQKLYFETPVRVDRDTVVAFGQLMSLANATHFRYDQDKRAVTVTVSKIENVEEIRKMVPAILKTNHIYTVVKYSTLERVVKALHAGLDLVKIIGAVLLPLIESFVAWIVPIFRKLWARLVTKN
jgi:hypothetical protein